jgi:GMP synthase-like glutamine amidotransferase
MKLGILQTGAPPPDLKQRFGDFPAMLTTLVGPGFEAETFDIVGGQAPPCVEACEAYLITGSPAGVYEDLPWIAPLIEFLRSAKGRARLVGICFGHQVLAKAFGGEVIKSPKGWGVGLHRYGVAERGPWMDGAEEVRIAVSHQDQVVALPPACRVSLSSAFTPYAGLAYDDGSAISFQGHPEFDPDFAMALIEARRGNRYTDAQADAALSSLAGPNDREKVARWIRGFLLGEGCGRPN